MRVLKVMFLTIMVGLAVAQTNQAQAPTVVPEVLRYGGQLPNTDGMRTQKLLRFSIYAQQASSSPMWSEEQVVWVNSNGSFNVLLGTATENGVPARLFVVSVPYALKASDAETLGGLPASAFLRATPSPRRWHRSCRRGRRPPVTSTRLP
jgi:hypothetical protein